MSVLYWLESIRNPFLDEVMKLFTLLGSELLFIVLALTVFWCVDKREGCYLLFVGFFGTILNQFLKLLCRIPRPWVNSKLTVVDGAKEDAGGFSFPSGHTQNITGTLGSVARWHRQTWLRILCVVLILLTSFSRMYLGVHTPLDVSVSLLIGTVLIFVFYPIVKNAADHPGRMYLLLGIMTVLSLAFTLYANLCSFEGVAEADWFNIEEGRKNSYSLLGALLGFCLAYPLERKYVNFDEGGVWWVQAIKLLGGLASLLAIKEGLKALFGLMGFTWLGANAIRYFAVVLFAAFVWPMAFSRINWLCQKKTS